MGDEQNKPITPTVLGSQPDHHGVTRKTRSETDQQMVKEFAKRGAICEVFDHWWTGHPENKSTLDFETPILPEQPLKRVCKFCGKVQGDQVRVD